MARARADIGISARARLLNLSRFAEPLLSAARVSD